MNSHQSRGSDVEYLIFYVTDGCESPSARPLNINDVDANVYNFATTSFYYDVAMW